MLGEVARLVFGLDDGGLVLRVRHLFGVRLFNDAVVFVEFVGDRRLILEVCLGLAQDLAHILCLHLLLILCERISLGCSEGHQWVLCRNRQAGLRRQSFISSDQPVDFVGLLPLSLHPLHQILVIQI